VKDPRIWGGFKKSLTTEEYKKIVKDPRIWGGFNGSFRVTVYPSIVKDPRIWGGFSIWVPIIWQPYVV
jgi:hypothetical protein